MESTLGVSCRRRLARTVRSRHERLAGLLYTCLYMHMRSRHERLAGLPAVALRFLPESSSALFPLFCMRVCHSVLCFCFVLWFQYSVSLFILFVSDQGVKNDGHEQHSVLVSVILCRRLCWHWSSRYLDGYHAWLGVRTPCLCLSLSLSLSLDSRTPFFPCPRGESLSKSF